PPDEIVGTEDASHAPAARLRIHVAISPEDSAWGGQVAHEVVTQHAGTNDVVRVFFHASAEVVDPGELARVTETAHAAAGAYRVPLGPLTEAEEADQRGG
ncbi:MAG TPA: hypothetical protein VGR22_06685, partial [Thermomicrobiales bacterium]|nr:hypothetical protein [Thermomicrobiales bacterium]